MGAALSSLWTALGGETAVPTTVLVPPLFKPDGVSQRSAAAKSGYASAFRPVGLKQLVQDYLQPAGGVTCKLLLTPPGSGDVIVAAVVRSGAAAGGTQKGGSSSAQPLDATVSLRWQPVPTDSSNFAEVKASGVGVTARGAVWSAGTGLGAFASASSTGDTSLGVRLSGHSVGAGAALVATSGGGAQLATGLPVVAWAVARRGRFTVGLERRPVEGACLLVVGCIPFQCGSHILFHQQQRTRGRPERVEQPPWHLCHTAIRSAARSPSWLWPASTASPLPSRFAHSRPAGLQHSTPFSKSTAVVTWLFPSFSTWLSGDE